MAVADLGEGPGAWIAPLFWRPGGGGGAGIAPFFWFPPPPPPPPLSEGLDPSLNATATWSGNRQTTTVSLSNPLLCTEILH